MHPSGAPGEHWLIKVPLASGVVVHDGEDVVLTAQDRFALDQRMIEIVKGGGKDDEDSLACAQREAREELGVVAGRWIPLGFAYEI
ncbi:MAG TPA: NUDIX domain-containing protein, partial [Candidatus Acidoferrales bacterium]|nr:NUDIX domain-containing protein [Candidatus Acidoferrales bacterium]